ncbi:MAPEG family protein [Emcibacter sp.]|uniref:MAPEG family protein n=1 Tax=Emcibacter sp. TaxID=1979954 RepID=UPI002AA62FD5|nr:MAPEG family protein [Emcibacter sp.]
MKDQLILWPMLVQMLIPLWLYVRLAKGKKKAAAEGTVDEARRSLYADAWPDNVIQLNNSIRNQFELPVLYYALVLTLYMLGDVTLLAHVAAWLFPATRIVHAAIHTGNNFVPLRRSIFTLGCFIVIILLVLTAIRLLSWST